MSLDRFSIEPIRTNKYTMIDIKIYFQLVFYTISIIGLTLICILPKKRDKSIQNQLPTYNNDTIITSVKHMDTVSY